MEKFIKSVGYALKGIVAAWTEQTNLKIQSVIAVIVIFAGFYFRITSIEWMVLLLMIGMVISLELVNSALEDMVNLVTKERHPLAGRIKDMAAGAVLVFSFIAATIGVIIFWKYIF
jgi:diacylglycerol kinase